MPAAGRILEIGCGHGLFSTYLALESPDRLVVGTDVDGDKILAAQRAAEGVDGLTFEVSTELAPGPWDAICVVDVLYLIDRAAQAALVREAASRLAPGGVLVIKEMATTPWWKFQWMALQERISVQVLQITEGHDLTFVPPQEVGGWMADAGLVVEHHRLDARHLHPHHLVVGRTPKAS